MSEAGVEAAAACSADVGEDAVEGHAAGFILIKAFVEEIAEESAALGDAGGVGAVDMCNSGCVVFEPGDKVADGCEPKAGDYGVFDDVDELVDAAGVKPGVEVDAPLCAVADGLVKLHSERGMVWRGPSGVSRTVWTLRES